MEDIKPEVQIKYSSYTPAQKRATQKYRENNKIKVNEQRKKYYQNRKERDPEFLEYKRMKAKEYYMIKKMSKIIINEPDELTETGDVEVPIETTPMVIIEQPTLSLQIPDITIEEPATLYQEPQTPRPARIKIICKKKSEIKDEV